MSKTLFIVESPNKISKLQKILGKDFIVLASVGHITDLAKGGSNGIGIDIENDFRPKYVLMPDKIQVLNDLIQAAKRADNILLATDDDREGEAIAWHLKSRLQTTNKPISRVTFKELTKVKVLGALSKARDIDINMFRSQEVRRILDRIVGFTVSPFLINFFGPNLSAGRVQSVVTRMVVDREDEISSFTPEDFWTIQVKLTDNTTPFVTKYDFRITDEVTAKQVTSDLKNTSQYTVTDVNSDDERKYPTPPLITSTLQRMMSRTHNFAADRTMKAAQSLYESGFVTYIRTDSVSISQEALDQARDYLKDNYPIPNKPNVYKNKEAAFDAHECIRPSDVTVEDDPSLSSDEKKVYQAIRKYFLASQMNPAVYQTLKLTIKDSTGKLILKTSGKAIKEKGYLEMLGVEDNSSIDIPHLKKGDVIFSVKNGVKPERKQTQPPPRYSEDKLLKDLEIRKIGRPATYAEILSKICNRNYVEKKGNIFYPTDLGKKITGILTDYFVFMDYDYTSNLETKLDLIAEDKENYLKVLSEFYKPFSEQMKKAYQAYSSEVCDKCGSGMVKRKNKKDEEFWACVQFPKCRNAKSI